MISLKNYGWKHSYFYLWSSESWLIETKQQVLKEIGRKKSRKFKNFLADLTQINWNNYLKIYKNDADLRFELFLGKINFLYNKQSPFTKRSNWQDPLKPWLTTGIIKSIRIKNNLHKRFCQATNPAQSASLHQKFENYRNQIVTLYCQ